MRDFDYSDLRVRDDIRAAHRALWAHISAPGNWWTGAERVAMVAEARRADGCDFCVARKSALSPAAVRGVHQTEGPLPANIVDIIHRVRTDPARLSRQWFDTVISDGLAVASYVELIGVVTMVTGVDYFARALGVAPFPLPAPRPGAPAQCLPACATTGTAWVPMIAPEDAVGPEADLYPAGTMIPNIVRALSLAPAEVRMLQVLSAAHYVPLEQLGDPTVGRALDRMQMELVAARVSALNQCFY